MDLRDRFLSCSLSRSSVHHHQPHRLAAAMEKNRSVHLVRICDSVATVTRPETSDCCQLYAGGSQLFAGFLPPVSSVSWLPL